MGQINFHFYIKPTSEDTIETLYDKTNNYLSGVVDFTVNKLGMQPKIALMFCCIAARVGLMGDGTLKEELRDTCLPLIKNFFKEVNPAVLEHFIVAPIDEMSFSLLTNAYKTNSELGDLLFGLVECFGYINGGLDDSVLERLYEIQQNN